MRTAAVIPAFDNEATIAMTIQAVGSRVDEVLVVDDHSNDSTALRAESAGARVVRLSKNLGKGRALERGMAETSADVIVMVDGDTGGSASSIDPLLQAVVSGEADMAVGVLPPAGSKGGFGLVRRTAASFIKASSGFESRAPMSGQRALTRDLFERCRPFAHGFAVDAALTADAVRRGLRVVEIQIEMTHDHRGRTVAGFAHRAGQGLHLLRAFIPRLLRLR